MKKSIFLNLSLLTATISPIAVQLSSCSHNKNLPISFFVDQANNVVSLNNKVIINLGYRNDGDVTIENVQLLDLDDPISEVIPTITFSKTTQIIFEQYNSKTPTTNAVLEFHLKNNSKPIKLNLTIFNARCEWKLKDTKKKMSTDKSVSFVLKANDEATKGVEFSLSDVKYVCDDGNEYTATQSTYKTINNQVNVIFKGQDGQELPTEYNSFGKISCKWFVFNHPELGTFDSTLSQTAITVALNDNTKWRSWTADTEYASSKMCLKSVALTQPKPGAWYTASVNLSDSKFKQYFEGKNYTSFSISFDEGDPLLLHQFSSDDKIILHVGSDKIDLSLDETNIYLTAQWDEKYNDAEIYFAYYLSKVGRDDCNLSTMYLEWYE